MKKVVIFTYNRSYNFGASLQAFALLKYVRKLGAECRLIDTRTQKEINNHIPARRGFKGIISNFFTLFHKNDLKLGRKRFNEFHSPDERTENFSSNDKKIIDYKKLENCPPKADVYISGSDQVFSPSLMSRLYFLDFNTNGAKRISYAASIGVDKIPIDKQERFKQYVNRFDAISVREPVAQRLINDLCGVDADIHIDPTFLLSTDEWQKEEREYSKLKGKKYIFAYFIYRPKGLNKILKKLEKETGLPVVLVDTVAFRNIYNSHIVLDAGPREFIWLLRNAELVITSSFHATTFSIIYNKNFVVYNNANTYSRIDNVLQIFNLKNHQILEDSELNVGKFYVEKSNKYKEIIDKKEKEARIYLGKNIGREDDEY